MRMTIVTVTIATFASYRCPLHICHCWQQMQQSWHQIAFKAPIRCGEKLINVVQQAVNWKGSPLKPLLPPNLLEQGNLSFKMVVVLHPFNTRCFSDHYLFWSLFILQPFLVSNFLPFLTLLIKISTVFNRSWNNGYVNQRFNAAPTMSTHYQWTKDRHIFVKLPGKRNPTQAWGSEMEAVGVRERKVGFSMGASIV